MGEVDSAGCPQYENTRTLPHYTGTTKQDFCKVQWVTGTGRHDPYTEHWRFGTLYCIKICCVFTLVKGEELGEHDWCGGKIYRELAETREWKGGAFSNTPPLWAVAYTPLLTPLLTQSG